MGNRLFQRCVCHHEQYDIHLHSGRVPCLHGSGVSGGRGGAASGVQSVRKFTNPLSHFQNLVAAEVTRLKYPEEQSLLTSAATALNEPPSIMQKSISLLVLVWLASLTLCPMAEAQLAVGNIRPAQRANTKLVDIDYDITGTNVPVSVSLQGSADGGATWTLLVNTLTGAIGTDVTPGNNLRITWNAGVDWNQQFSTRTKFRITVSVPGLLSVPDSTTMSRLRRWRLRPRPPLPGSCFFLPSGSTSLPRYYRAVMQRSGVVRRGGSRLKMVVGASVTVQVNPGRA